MADDDAAAEARAEAILSYAGNFAVGITRMERDGIGSEVLGSGVLVSIEGRRGILTCGHVAEQYEKLSEIGLVNYVADKMQRRKVRIDDALHVILGSTRDWTEHGHDLAFTLLPPETAGSIGAQNVFLNMEKNHDRVQAGHLADQSQAESILGLVEELSEEPFAEGFEAISPMRGMLFTGQIVSQEKGLLTFEAMNDQPDDGLESYGGMSGGGLWRIGFADEENAVLGTRMLIGIASWQNGRAIRCQGWDRIDQALIPLVRDQLKF